MDDLFVHGVEDIFKFMRTTTGTWMFRGVTDTLHELTPSIGRTKRKDPFDKPSSVPSSPLHCGALIGSMRCTFA